MQIIIDREFCRNYPTKLISFVLQGFENKNLINKKNPT